MVSTSARVAATCKVANGPATSFKRYTERTQVNRLDDGIAVDGAFHLVANRVEGLVDLTETGRGGVQAPAVIPNLVVDERGQVELGQGSLAQFAGRCRPANRSAGRWQFWKRVVSIWVYQKDINE